jgi:hypothetical protein
VKTTSAAALGAARQSPDHSPTSAPRRRQRNTATQASALPRNRPGQAHHPTASSPVAARRLLLLPDPAARRTATTLLAKNGTHTHGAAGRMASGERRSTPCPQFCAVRASVRLRWCVCWSSVSIADACAMSRRVASGAPRCCHGAACCRDRAVISSVLVLCRHTSQVTPSFCACLLCLVSVALVYLGGGAYAGRHAGASRGTMGRDQYGRYRPSALSRGMLCAP